MNNGQFERGDRVRIIPRMISAQHENLRGRVLTVREAADDYIALNGYVGWFWCGWFELAKEPVNADAQSRKG